MKKEEFITKINAEIEKGEQILERFSNLQCINSYSIYNQYDESAKQRLMNDLHIWEMRVFEILKAYFGTKSQDIANEFSISAPNQWHDFKIDGIERVNYNLTTLKSILERLDYIEINTHRERESNNVSKDKPFKVFISHATDDRDFVNSLVKLLEFIGLNNENLFCSSIPGYMIPSGKNIFDFLREQFENYNLFVIFIHSQNYYNSAISLNEMGAAWVLKSDFHSLLVKGFNYSNMKGVISSQYISTKVDGNDANARLNELKNQLVSIFNLPPKGESTWEERRKEFLTDVNA